MGQPNRLKTDLVFARQAAGTRGGRVRLPPLDSRETAAPKIVKATRSISLTATRGSTSPRPLVSRAARRRYFLTEMRCDECGSDAVGSARGWVAVRLDLADNPDPPEVAIFCPACVEAEFEGRSPTDARSLHSDSDQI
jgi:hypothetical protein